VRPLRTTSNTVGSLRSGETVEIVLPDRSEPTVFEVVRSGRTLPGGDVWVYLAQV